MLHVYTLHDVLLCRSGAEECQDVHEPVLRKRYGGGRQVEGGQTQLQQRT